MDEESCGDNVHNINLLTLIASESYATFVDDLQSETKKTLYDRPTKATMESLKLRPIEQAKIKCARKLFNELSTSKVKYHDVDSYENL